MVKNPIFGKMSKLKQYYNSCRMDDENECPVCNNKIILPFIIEQCQHKLCYLCAKGVVLNGLNGCPLCRGPINVEALNDCSVPNFDLKIATSDGTNSENSQPSTSDTEAKRKYYWLYKAHGDGWWRYEPLVESEIEMASRSNLRKFEITICGFRYVIDFGLMKQYRKTGIRSYREEKRVSSRMFDRMNVKGIAGVVPKPQQDT